MFTALALLTERKPKEECPMLPETTRRAIVIIAALTTDTNAQRVLSEFAHPSEIGFRCPKFSNTTFEAFEGGVARGVIRRADEKGMLIASKPVEVQLVTPDQLLELSQRGDLLVLSFSDQCRKAFTFSKDNMKPRPIQARYSVCQFGTLPTQLLKNLVSVLHDLLVPEDLGFDTSPQITTANFAADSSGGFVGRADLPVV